MKFKKAILKRDNLQYIFCLSAVLLGLFLLPSCSATKKGAVSNNNRALEQQSPAYLLEQLEKHRLDVEWLSAKARITFKDQDQVKKFSANIRLRKDSLVWLNIKKASIEAARILVDKDSVYVIDRLNKEYLVKDLSFLEEEFNLPAEFSTLQTAILGNPWFFENQEFQAETKDNRYLLVASENKGFFSDYSINANTYTLEQMSFLDLKNDRGVKIFMDQYQPIDEKRLFAFFRRFLVQSEQTGEADISLDFSKVELDIPQKMPFSISNRYKRIH